MAGRLSDLARTRTNRRKAQAPPATSGRADVLRRLTSHKRAKVQLSHKKELTDADLEHATEVDLDRVVALVATVGLGDAEAIIAGARYVSDPGPAPHCNAEIAFLVEEDYQGRGIARCLLDHLVRIACAKGLSQLHADVLANNRPMLTVFERSGLPIRKTQFQDVIHVTLSLDQRTC